MKSGTQLQWRICWKEDGRVIEQESRGVDISQDKFLDESQQAEFQKQFEFDDHILALCCLAALNTWDKVEESGKRSESLAKIIQGKKKKDFH